MKIAGRSPLALMFVGWLAGLATIGVVGLAVPVFGLFDVRASTPDDPWFALATHGTMIRATRLRAIAITAPQRFTAAQVQAGFSDYDRFCVSCHVGLGVDRQSWASGMRPTPPYLLDAARNWTPAQLKMIVGDGVKMTGMPAWRRTLSDDQQWDVVAFLDAMPYLTASDYLNLRSGQKPRT